MTTTTIWTSPTRWSRNGRRRRCPAGSRADRPRCRRFRPPRGAALHVVGRSMPSWSRIVGATSTSSTKPDRCVVAVRSSPGSTPGARSASNVRCDVHAPCAGPTTSTASRWKSTSLQHRADELVGPLQRLAETCGPLARRRRAPGRGPRGRDRTPRPARPSPASRSSSNAPPPRRGRGEARTGAAGSRREEAVVDTPAGTGPRAHQARPPPAGGRTSRARRRVGLPPVGVGDHRASRRRRRARRRARRSRRRRARTRCGARSRRCPGARARRRPPSGSLRSTPRPRSRRRLLSAPNACPSSVGPAPTARVPAPSVAYPSASVERAADRAGGEVGDRRAVEQPVRGSGARCVDVLPADDDGSESTSTRSARAASPAAVRRRAAPPVRAPSTHAASGRRGQRPARRRRAARLTHRPRRCRAPSSATATGTSRFRLTHAPVSRRPAK